MLAPLSEPDRLLARVAQTPQSAATKAAVLAQTGDGRTLARAEIDLPAGATTGQAAIVGPPELRNRITRLVLEGAPAAGSVALLDEGLRRHPVGLALEGDQAQADAPFLGSLYYVRRALAPFTELRVADLSTLLGRDMSMLVPRRRPLPRRAGPGCLDTLGGGTADCSSASPVRARRSRRRHRAGSVAAGAADRRQS